MLRQWVGVGVGVTFSLGQLSTSYTLGNGAEKNIPNLNKNTIKGNICMLLCVILGRIYWLPLKLTLIIAVLERRPNCVSPRK